MTKKAYKLMIASYLALLIPLITLLLVPAMDWRVLFLYTPSIILTYLFYKA